MIIDIYKWTGNNIGDSGAIMISEALKINTTLTRLYLNGDEIKKKKLKKKKINKKEMDIKNYEK